jgi:hypothetical protein
VAIAFRLQAIESGERFSQMLSYLSMTIIISWWRSLLIHRRSNEEKERFSQMLRYLSMTIIISWWRSLLIHRRSNQEKDLARCFVTSA